MKRAKLYVNDTYSGVSGGTFNDEKFTFYVRNKFKSTDKVELEGLDSKDSVLVERTIVEILSGISASYSLESKSINGEYKGEIDQVKVYVNGRTRVTGGDFEEESFEIPVSTRINVGDKVEVEGLDKNNKVITEKQSVEIV
ncbi:hypothetical protein PMT42_09910 [Enterococcus faecalis]|nr:hypothetical protein [Enterococcus faecalis]